MAVGRKTLSEIAADAPKADWDKVDAATDEDIDRMIAEDEDVAPDTTTLDESISPQAIRKGLGMTQERFAAALRIPLATLRNWE
ncbi:MAG TPA: XRE family transcriptional regulator [Microvirga sp.]|nr:XRE family transcriptional regulator [Microvirga sp.]